MKKVILMMASVAMLYSCAEPNAELGQDSTLTKEFSVEVSMNDEQTRVSADTSSDDTWTFGWEETDQIAAIGNDESLEKLKIKNYDPNKSTFYGEIAESVEKVRLVSPFTVDPTTIDIATQNGKLGSTYMMSEDWITVDGNISAPVMKHLGAFMVVNATFENVVEGYYLVGVEYSGVPTTATLDAEASYADALTVGENGTISVHYAADAAVAITEGLNHKIYLNVLPFTFDAGETISVRLLLAPTANGKGVPHEFVDARPNNGSAIEVKRATFSTTSVVCDMTGMETPEPTISLAVSCTPSDYTFVVGADDNSTGVPTVKYTNASELSKTPDRVTYQLMDHTDEFTIDAITGVLTLNNDYTTTKDVTFNKIKIKVSAFYNDYTASAVILNKTNLYTITVTPEGDDSGTTEPVQAFEYSVNDVVKDVATGHKEISANNFEISSATASVDGTQAKFSLKNSKVIIGGETVTLDTSNTHPVDSYYIDIKVVDNVETKDVDESKYFVYKPSGAVWVKILDATEFATALDGKVLKPVITIKKQGDDKSEFTFTSSPITITVVE